jgi:hypothetical protein
MLLLAMQAKKKPQLIQNLRGAPNTEAVELCWVDKVFQHRLGWVTPVSCYRGCLLPTWHRAQHTAQSENPRIQIMYAAASACAYHRTVHSVTGEWCDYTRRDLMLVASPPPAVQPRSQGLREGCTSSRAQSLWHWHFIHPASSQTTSKALHNTIKAAKGCR